MKLPNGCGSVRKLSGNRRKPYTVVITMGFEFDDKTGKNKQIRKYLGYFKTKNEALSALANYNKDNTNYSNEVLNQNIICKPNNKATRQDLFNNSLLKGEYYDTKNNRYMYRKMVNGYRKTITAPTLEELRDKEKNIEKEINARKEERSTQDFINFIQNELPDVFKELKHEFNKMEDFKNDTG